MMSARGRESAETEHKVSPWTSGGAQPQYRGEGERRASTGLGHPVRGHQEGAPRHLRCLPPPPPAAKHPLGPEKPAPSPLQEKLWADMEQRESRLAITQLISAM